MLGWHSLIGVGEALITGLVVASVVAVRPDLVYGARAALRSRELEIRSGNRTEQEVVA
jgi:cobalt/nickel transport system permease protein